MSHLEVEKAIKSVIALTHNSREILHKMSDWAMSTNPYIRFNLIDSATGGYQRSTVQIPTVFSILTPYWGTPFSANDRRDAFIDKMRFYSSEGGWVYEKQPYIPENQQDSGYSAVDSRFWESKVKPLAEQYYHNDVATYTHVDAIFRNKVVRFFNEDTTIKNENGTYVIDADNIPSSYIDIKTDNLTFKPKFMSVSGTNAGISFGDNGGSNYTKSHLYNRDVYIGYSAAFNPNGSISQNSVKTNYLHLESLSAIYIGSNSYDHPAGGASRKKIYIGNAAAPYSNIDISIAGSRFGAYATDEMWLGKWYGTSTSVASAVNIVGRNIGIANFNNSTNSNIYLTIGHSSIKLHDRLIAYSGSHYYKDRYTLSADKAISIGSGSEFVEVGSYSTAGSYFGHRSSYAGVGNSATKVEAFKDSYNTDIGSVDQGSIPLGEPTPQDVQGWDTMSPTDLTIAYNALLASYYSQPYFAYGLNIGTNRYAINIGANAKNINVGYGETSSVIRGKSLVASAANTRITGTEDVIIDGGKDVRYGKGLPTIKAGMWNDSRHAISVCGLGVDYYKGVGDGQLLNTIHAIDSLAGGITVTNIFGQPVTIANNSQETGFMFSRVKRYVARLKNKKLIIHMKDESIGNSEYDAVYVKCITDEDIKIKVQTEYIRSVGQFTSTTGDDISGHLMPRSSRLIYDTPGTPNDSLSNDSDDEINPGAKIHSYVPVPEHVEMLLAIEIYENDAGDIILRKITDRSSNGVSSNADHSYFVNNIHVPHNHGGFRKACIISKSIRTYASGMKLAFPTDPTNTINSDGFCLDNRGVWSPNYGSRHYARYMTSDIFGIGARRANVTSDQSINTPHYGKFTHALKVMRVDGEWSINGQITGGTIERPLLMAFAYNNTQEIGFNINNREYGTQWTGQQAKCEVISTYGNYRVPIVVDVGYSQNGNARMSTTDITFRDTSYHKSYIDGYRVNTYHSYNGLAVFDRLWGNTAESVVAYSNINEISGISNSGAYGGMAIRSDAFNGGGDELSINGVYTETGVGIDSMGVDSSGVSVFMLEKTTALTLINKLNVAAAALGRGALTESLGNII